MAICIGNLNELNQCDLIADLKCLFNRFQGTDCLRKIEQAQQIKNNQLGFYLHKMASIVPKDKTNKGSVCGNISIKVQSNPDEEFK